MTDLRERTSSNEPAPIGSGRSVLLVTFIALALIAVAIVPMLRSSGEPERRSSAEVVVNTAAPTQAPAAAPARPAPPECPTLDNPGGRLNWEKSADAGPWPTNGRVALPKLGVSAPVVKVGVDTKGLMVVPKNAHEVAWLDQGPINAGRTRNTVLAGHINYNRKAGTFSRLGTMAAGDSVELEMDGAKYIYQVKWTCLFDRNTERASQIMGFTEKPSVTLISCGGVFDRRAGTHNKRIAVRAELIQSSV